MQSLPSRASAAYRVLINHDRQLVVWPEPQPAPRDWEATGVGGTQAECVTYVDGLSRQPHPASRPPSRGAEPRLGSAHETLELGGDENALIERLRLGDEATFSALVDRYHGSFVRLALGYVRDRSIAEEVAQEAWLGIVRGLHKFAGRASFKTWMFRILVNCAKHRALRETRTVAFSEQWESAEDFLEPAVPSEWFRGSQDQWPGGWVVFPGDWGNDPERRLLSAEARHELSAMIECLPLRQRQVLVLRDVDGLSASEVCETLALSESNQRVLLHRARSTLRRLLADHLLGE